MAVIIDITRIFIPRVIGDKRIKEFIEVAVIKENKM
jgi:hypothetical protein